MRLWKWLGLGAFVGVAATGVVIARNERQRRAYTPDEVRDQLHARLAETPEDPEARPAPGPDRPASQA
jgi:hypothetical protein